MFNIFNISQFAQDIIQFFIVNIIGKRDLLGDVFLVPNRQ